MIKPTNMDVTVDEMVLHQPSSIIARIITPFRFVVLVLFTLLAVIDRWLLPNVSLELFYLIPILLLSIEGIIYKILFAIILSLSLLKMTFQIENGSWDFSIQGSYWEIFTLFSFYGISAIAVLGLTDLYKKNKRLVERDSQTELLNRDAFLERVNAEINRSNRNGSRFSVAYIDLDNFKALNDSMGHVAGDSIIDLMRFILSSSLRDYDHTARMGGDEFAILFPETSSVHAKKIIKRLQEEFLTMQVESVSCIPYLDMSNDEGMKLLPITFSAGVVTYQTPSMMADEIVHRADRLMSQAKREKQGGRRSRNHATLKKAKKNKKKATP